MTLGLFDYFGIVGFIIGIVMLILTIRFLIDVPDNLKRIADELEKLNNKK